MQAKLAVSYAERLVKISHHQKPAFLLTLARAYEAAGQQDQTRQAAREGLNLLPDSSAGPSRDRKLLERLAR